LPIRSISREIGLGKARRIIDERSKGGNFRNWADFENRIAGGEKSVFRLSQVGLMVNGKPKDGAEMNKKNTVKSTAKSNGLSSLPSIQTSG